MIFISVHLLSSGNEVLINPTLVAYVQAMPANRISAECCRIYFSANQLDYIEIKETLAEVSALLKGS